MLRIHRAKLPPQDAVAVPHSLIFDTRISIAARGFYAWMLSYPDLAGYSKIKIYEFAKAKGERVGRQACYTLLGELERAGYYSTPKANQYGAVRGKPGSIYLIGPNNEGEYKIGCSRNLKQRLKAIKHSHGQSCEVIKAWPTQDMGTVEEKLHQMFDDWATGGEWFAFDHPSLDIAIYRIDREVA